MDRTNCIGDEGNAIRDQFPLRRDRPCLHDHFAIDDRKRWMTAIRTADSEKHTAMEPEKVARLEEAFDLYQ